MIQMNKYFLLIYICFLFAACSRKTVPAKVSNGAVVTENNNTTTNNNTNILNNNSTTDTSSSVNNSEMLAFIVVTNGYGKIINGQDALPADADVHFNNLQLSKGFSAQELSNLKARYKTIPPRVLFVNPAKQSSSARGTFYILGKKFWYWKQKDGFFYLDEKYYL